MTIIETERNPLIIKCHPAISIDSIAEIIHNEYSTFIYRTGQNTRCEVMTFYWSGEDLKKSRYKVVPYCGPKGSYESNRVFNSLLNEVCNDPDPKKFDRAIAEVYFERIGFFGGRKKESMARIVNLAHIKNAVRNESSPYGEFLIYGSACTMSIELIKPGLEQGIPFLEDFLHQRAIIHP